MTPEVRQRVWKHVRAALVLFHVSTMVLAALPAPVNGMNRDMWKNPTAQMEFKAWADGLRMKPEVFEEGIWKLAVFWMGVREVYLTPVQPYIRYTGTEQPWRMFVGPDRFPPRYQVQAKTATTDYATLYEERSPEFRWHEDYFTQERVRSYLYRYAWPEYSGWNETACRYLARQIFQERPDVTDVRCRTFKQKSQSVEEVRAKVPLEPGQWVHESVIHR